MRAVEITSKNVWHLEKFASRYISTVYYFISNRLYFFQKLHYGGRFLGRLLKNSSVLNNNVFIEYGVMLNSLIELSFN